MDSTRWRVVLEGEDISDNVSGISDISASLDIENPTEFTTDNARMEVFAPFSEDLVFNAEVEIFAGSKKVFVGRILRIDKDVKERTADVLVSDVSQRMRNENLDDFGLAKRVRVTKAADTDSGEYPWTNKLSPVSDGSLKNPISDGAALTVVHSFLTEGKLDPTNISYDETTLRSEGESLPQNPDVTIKAPYRWKNVPFLVDKILEHYDLTDDAQILRDTVLDENHFSTNGRVGYDLENELDTNNPTAEGTETAIFWTGGVTDFLVDGGKFYFLYSSRINNPSIIEYNPTTDTYREIYKRSSHAEWWKFQKDGNRYFILGTTKSSVQVDLPVLGAYDPTEITSGTFIELVNPGGTPPIQTYIDSGNTHKPVVGMYYQMGFDIDGANNNVRQGIQPDTRKGFILRNGLIYYIYANSLSCGIASADGVDSSTSVVVVPRDNYFNHLGLDFTIDGSTLYGGATFQKETESSRIIFSKAL